MAISYLIMKTFGGDIKVRSQLSVGSCFKVTFPAEIAEIEEPAESSATEETGQDTAPQKSLLNILVAEDSDINAKILTKILTSKRHTVEVAENGQVAVDKFVRSGYKEFDVILMDVQMPVMDGYIAAKTIRGLDREDAATITIFACTANTFKEDKDQAQEASMNDFISKPINIPELFEKLDKLIVKEK